MNVGVKKCTKQPRVPNNQLVPVLSYEVATDISEEDIRKRVEAAYRILFDETFKDNK